MYKFSKLAFRMYTSHPLVSLDQHKDNLDFQVKTLLAEKYTRALLKPRFDPLLWC